MDQDNQTPIARTFKDDVFDLGDGFTLWLSFSPLRQSYNMAVTGPQGSRFYDTFNGSSADVKGWLDSYANRYGVKIPRNFYTHTTAFQALVPDSFIVDVDLADPDAEYSECEACGSSDSNLVSAFYFPPVKAGGEGSLAVHWEFGCYGGTTIAGTVSDVKGEVLDLLRLAITGTDQDSVSEELEQFATQVKNIK